ncbi:MAG: autotransporter domain-containing protein [Planctomycetaceae bacterium]|nr:autotransporter domain-containing protein [Planctomycetaceae bacterium]
MKVEKSTPIFKTSDDSMVNNETKSNKKNLNKKSYRPLSKYANTKYNLKYNIIKTVFIALVTTAFFFTTEILNNAYAQYTNTFQEVRYVDTQVPTGDPNNPTATSRVRVYFYGSSGTGWSIDWNTEWINAVMIGFQYVAQLYDMARGLEAIPNPNYPGEFPTDPWTDPDDDNDPNDPNDPRLGRVYRIYLGNPPQDQASSNNGVRNIYFDIDRVADRQQNGTYVLKSVTDFNTADYGQVRDHNVEQKYNWKTQTIHELVHLLGFQADMDENGFFNTVTDYYRENLRNSDGSAPTMPLAGEQFTDWEVYSAMFVGGTALAIFNDNPTIGTSGTSRNSGTSSSSNRTGIPLGATGGGSPISNDAHVNHLEYDGMNTYPIMGWDIETEYARPFLSELELAMLLDSSNPSLPAGFELQDHFGMSIYQKHGNVVNGQYDPFKLIYTWDQTAHMVTGNFTNGNPSYDTYLADYAIGLHIVSGYNILSYSNGSSSISNTYSTTGLHAFGKYSAGVRIENYGNWLSIESGTAVSGQYGILFASGSAQNRDTNAILINRGVISSTRQRFTTDDNLYLKYQFIADSTSYSTRTADYDLDGDGSNDTVYDKNGFNVGIYLDAWADQINIIGTGKLYNGVLVDTATGIRNGINFIGEVVNGENYVPEAHGNFMNLNDDSYTHPVITFGKKYNGEDLDKSYTIQWVDAKDKDDNLIATIYNKQTGQWEVIYIDGKIGTGEYQVNGSGGKTFVSHVKYEDLPDKYHDVNIYGITALDQSGNSYNDTSIKPLKINEGINDPYQGVGEWFGEFYTADEGASWDVEYWGGTTNMYIPNQKVYGEGGNDGGGTVRNGTSSSTTYIPSTYFQIDYTKANFYVGADDKGASYLTYDPVTDTLLYDPDDRRQGATAILQLNDYYENDDPYTNYHRNLDNYYYGDNAIFLFKNIDLGSKNNTSSILQGVGYYNPNTTTNSNSHTVSAIFEIGIDNWITIQDFYTVQANKHNNLIRLWKDDTGKLLGVDLNNHNDQIAQGLFRDPSSSNAPLPYLKDKDHWTELSLIVQCDDDLVVEMSANTTPGTGAFDKALGKISIFNRYSGVIQNNTNVISEYGIWVDRDYSDIDEINFGDRYGKITGLNDLIAGTFIENYGEISDMSFGNNNMNGTFDGVAAGTYIYNAFDAKMNENDRIYSGYAVPTALFPNSDVYNIQDNSFKYIVNGGEMNENGYILAGTDLINLITGEIKETGSRVVATRDMYNFGYIYNTALGSLTGGVYTLDGNIYNLDNGNYDDLLTARMYGNRHIVARGSGTTTNLQKEHYEDRTYFGTSGNIINTGKVGYTFGLEKYYYETLERQELILASIETTYDLINLGKGEIFDTTQIRVGRDLYNEENAKIKNTAYLDTLSNVYNRDAGEIFNTSIFTVNGDLNNEGWGVIDTGTKLYVKWNLNNGLDIVRSNDKDYDLTHVATIRNFATIQVNDGTLNNGRYGLITDNNTIITYHRVNNEGVIENFFNFNASQTISNSHGGIFSVAQEATLNADSTIENETFANMFIFGDVKTRGFENSANVFGTGTVYLTGTKGQFVNHSVGHIAPGGATVLMPYSDEENIFFNTYGNNSIGMLTIYGTLLNGAGKPQNGGTYDSGGTFDITVNPRPEGNPLNSEFALTDMRQLATAKNNNTFGRTDGGAGNNDLVVVRAVRDYNGNVLYGGDAIINGGTVRVEARDNISGTVDPARYVGGLRLPFLTTETGLTVNEELKVELPKEGTGIVLFDFTPEYDDFTYWLNIDRRYKYETAGKTYNQKSVARYIDNIGRDPNPESDFFQALVKLDSLSDNDPRNNLQQSYNTRFVSPDALFALDQMSGGIYGSMETASFQNISIVLSQLADYLRSDPLLTYCKDCRVYEPSKLDIWASAYGTLGGSDHDGNAYGYDQSTGGTIVGFDRLYINRLRAGIYGTFGSSTYKTDLLETSKATDISVGFYARRELNRGYVLGSFGFGFTDYHTTRQISFVGRSAKSDRNAYFWSAYIERALDLDSRIGRIQPYIGAQYIGNQFDNFNETGAGTLSLRGGSSDAHSLRSILGARFTQHPRMVRGGKLETFLNVNWKVEFLKYTKGNLNAQFTNPNFANFNGTDSFHIYGNKQNRSWLDAGFGTNWDRNNTRITLAYNIGINGDGFFLHTGNIAFIYAR